MIFNNYPKEIKKWKKIGVATLDSANVTLSGANRKQTKYITVPSHLNYDEYMVKLKGSHGSFSNISLSIGTISVYAGVSVAEKTLNGVFRRAGTYGLGDSLGVDSTGLKIYCNYVLGTGGLYNFTVELYGRKLDKETLHLINE